MFNKVILVGRLTRDPELRYTAGEGVAVVNFGLAVERPFTNKNGERDVDFLNIVVWRRQAENCANYLSKGSLVALDGRIQSRSYEDKEGKRRNFVEVVAENVKFLSWPKDDNRSNSPGATGSTVSTGSTGSTGSAGSGLYDDDFSSPEDTSDDFGLGGEEEKVDDNDVPF